ncbi:MULTISPECIES: hypothetical protein [Brachymonas]|uniref:hypothetical protein n=1 Tax=Brachymonas TaxID=28219 RepID=UPI0016AF5CB9|nr:hypothetical protein [Brachymonas sp. J145]MEE1653956.1 hypothetical protein [Brachymonas sp. J145]NLX16496.1 hypothetical protein [Ramlibacter sp.]
MTDKAPQQLQFIDTLPPQLRLALSRYKLRRSLNRPVSIEDDPDLQRLLELEKAWNASLPKTAATLPESAPPAPPAEPEPAAPPAQPRPVAAMAARPPQPDAAAEPAPASRQRRAARQANSTSNPLAMLQERDLGPVAGAALAAGQQLLQAWWARHPAKLALTVGTPLLERYAKRKPLQVLAIAAAVGAAVVVLRPWRWNRTRNMARKSMNREIRRMRLSSLWGMVTDSLLRNGKSSG